MDAAADREAVQRGVDWLVRAQDSTGQIPSVASSLVDGPPQWTPDSLKFITALGVLALEGLGDAGAQSVATRAVAFLRRERERSALWRYWASDNELYDYTPPDVDDTACCSMAVATRGDTTTANVRVLLANRDEDGRFYTWIIPHGRRSGIAHRWAVRGERASSVRQRRAELWANSEAVPDDVDGIVNANAIRYLGPDHAPREAVDWVVSILADGIEDRCDSWHRNRFTMYSSLADGARRGVTQFAQLGTTVLARIDERVGPDGTVGPPLDTAMALLAVRQFAGDVTLGRRLADGLRSAQLPDGSWEQSVFFYGGPNEQFGWASAALTTAYAVGALSGSPNGG